jgi:hypothetical protein
MTREELIELAYRVEALAGPDRKIMEECYRAVNDRRLFDAPSSPTFSEPYERWCRFKSFLNSEAWESAAMSLVPEGYSWTLGQNVHHGHWLCSINYVNHEGEPTCIADSGHRKSPALALTSAALRARVEQML